MKKKYYLLVSLLSLLTLCSCSNKDYDALLAHKHTYDPSTLKWDWKEKAEGGFDVNVSITCSTCEDSKEGHIFKTVADVRGPNVVKECGCATEGEVSYVASANINNITYYQTRFFTTVGDQHQLDDETLFNDEQYHWYQCANCLAVMGKEKHQFSDYVPRPGSYYYDHECQVCHYQESYFSTKDFNDHIATFNVGTITPFDKTKLDETKAIYDSLNEEQKKDITNYHILEECYTALDDFYAQWDVENGTFGSIFGNSIPSGHYSSPSSQSVKELHFDILKNTEKGDVLTMLVTEEFELAEDFGFYASSFAKKSQYVTGIMYIYCPEETQIVNINASTIALAMQINLVKGWNRIDFNESQWGGLNSQTYDQIRFTFGKKLMPVEECWMFTTAYGKVLDISTLNAQIAALPDDIKDFAPYRYGELVSIKSKYDSLTSDLQAKVDMTKVTKLMNDYNTIYRKTMSSFAWYQMMGNTLPVRDLYNTKPNATLQFSEDTTERGEALNVKAKQDFTGTAGFYFSTDNFSIRFDGTNVYKKMLIYIYSPIEKNIEIRNRINGDSYNTELIKTVKCSIGWNDIELDSTDLNKMAAKGQANVENLLAFFFEDGLKTTDGSFKFAVPYGVMK